MCAQSRRQPFVEQVTASVTALSKMATSLDAELKSLLAFYGEDPSSSEAPKPEELFGLVMTFSSSLQVHISVATSNMILTVT